MITYQDFAQAFSLFYGLLFLMLVGLAVSFFKPRWQRIVAVLVVTGFVAWPIVDRALEIAGKRQYAEAAWAHFNKLCKEKAGIKVYKTVEGVESVMLMKPRPTVGPDEKGLYDQFWKGDQYGGQSSGPWANERVIFELVANSDKSNKTAAVDLNIHGIEFSFIEAPELVVKPESLVWYKYFQDPLKYAALTKESIVQPTSRYAIDWDDISTPDDLQNWVSASHWRVIDRKTNELLAERWGYLIEPGFGIRGGARVPWLIAQSKNTSCPPVGRHNTDFLKQVLIPKSK